MYFGELLSLLVIVGVGAAVIVYLLVNRQAASGRGVGCGMWAVIVTALALSVFALVIAWLTNLRFDMSPRSLTPGEEALRWLGGVVRERFDALWGALLSVVLLALGLPALVAAGGRGEQQPAPGCAAYGLAAAAGAVALLGWAAALTSGGGYRQPPPEIVLLLRVGGTLALAGAGLFVGGLGAAARGPWAVPIAGFGLMLMMAGPNLSWLSLVHLLLVAAPLVAAGWLMWQRRTPAEVSGG